MGKLSDEWQTPAWLFAELNKEFSFDIDLCANDDNSKCPLFYVDYLRNLLTDKSNQRPNWKTKKPEGVCFMNPPYSNPKLFIKKAWEDSKQCKIVCLVKCDPSTRWWATFWEYDVVKTRDTGCNIDVYGKPFNFKSEYYIYNGPKRGCEVRFFPKRIKFDPPEGLNGKSGPSFSSALVIMDRRGL